MRLHMWRGVIFCTYLVLIVSFRLFHHAGRPSSPWFIIHNFICCRCPPLIFSLKLLKTQVRQQASFRVKPKTSDWETIRDVNVLRLVWVTHIQMGQTQVPRIGCQCTHINYITVGSRDVLLGNSWHMTLFYPAGVGFYFERRLKQKKKRRKKLLKRSFHSLSPSISLSSSL